MYNDENSKYIDRVHMMIYYSSTTLNSHLARTYLFWPGSGPHECLTIGTDLGYDLTNLREEEKQKKRRRNEGEEEGEDEEGSVGGRKEKREYGIRR